MDERERCPECGQLKPLSAEELNRSRELAEAERAARQAARIAREAAQAAEEARERARV